MAKLQPIYRSPFAQPGFFEPISRREAAQLICQWRRNGRSIDRMPCPMIPGGRRYKFWGVDGEDAAMVLKPNDAR